jgi:GNAT superfamily N-acetyltransferase
MGVAVRPLGPDDGDWLATQLRERWSDVHVARFGELVDASARPALVAELDGVAAGFVTLDVVGTGCEVLTIDAFVPWAGVGTALIRASEEYAREHGCDRLWLVTTNDNLPALRFYQRRGLRLVELRPGAVTEARRLKPTIPEVGHLGIEIQDELVLERRL